MQQLHNDGDLDYVKVSSENIAKALEKKKDIYITVLTPSTRTLKLEYKEMEQQANKISSSMKNADGSEFFLHYFSLDRCVERTDVIPSINIEDTVKESPSIYSMKLHDKVYEGNLLIIRVAGGWLYGLETVAGFATTLVPLHNEFKTKNVDNDF